MVLHPGVLFNCVLYCTSQNHPNAVVLEHFRACHLLQKKTLNFLVRFFFFAILTVLKWKCSRTCAVCDAYSYCLLWNDEVNSYSDSFFCCHCSGVCFVFFVLHHQFTAFVTGLEYRRSLSFSTLFCCSRSWLILLVTITKGTLACFAVELNKSIVLFWKRKVLCIVLREGCKPPV